MPSPLEMMVARAASRSASGLEGYEPPPIDPNTSATDILRNVGSMGLGAVSATGNLLDLPGSIARDLLAGKGFMSFDQLMTPFTDENRTTGRQLLHTWGLAPAEKETGPTPFADPKEFAYDTLGFLAEVYTDPFGPIGKLLKVPAAAARVLKAGGGLAEAGVRAIPFGNFTADLARSGAKRAKLLAKQFLYAPSGGTYDPRNQAISEAYHEAVRTGTDRIMGLASLAARYMDSTGWKMTADSPDYFDNMRAFRRYAEQTEEFAKTLDPNVKLFPDELKPVVEGLRQQADSLRVVESKYFNIATLNDQADISFWDRRMGDRFKDAILNEMGPYVSDVTRRLGGLPDGATNLREQLIKGFWGGTVDLNTILKDDRWNKLIKGVKAHPELRNMVDSLHQEYADVAGIRHVKSFAEKMDMSPKELWSELGFSEAKPWEPVQKVEAALNQFVGVQRDLAKKGLGKLRQKKAFGDLYIDLLSGKRTRVRFDKAGNPVLPGGQGFAEIGIEDDELFKWLREQTRDPETLERITMAEESGLRPVSWVIDGEHQFYIPEMSAKLDSQWDRQLNSFRKKVQNAPLREMEVVRDSIRHKLEAEFSDRIIKDMPHIDSDGMFNYIQSAMDEAGNIFPTGQTIRKRMSEATSFEEMYADDFDAGLLVQKMDDRYDALADFITSHAKVREMSLFDNDPIVDWADSMISRTKRIQMAQAVTKHIADSVVMTGGDTMKLKGSRVGLVRGEVPEGVSVNEFLKAKPHFDKDGIIAEVAEHLRRMSPDLVGNKPNISKDLPFSEEFRELVLNTPLDAKLTGELDKVFQFFEPLPEAGKLGQAADAFMAIHKASLLSTPSGVFRDAFSAGMNSILMGDMELSPTAAASAWDMLAIMRDKLPGRIDPKYQVNIGGKLVEKDDILEYLQSLNLPDTDANRAKAFASMFAGAMSQQRLHYYGGDVASMEVSGLAQNLLEGVPGANPKGIIGSLVDRFQSQSLGQNIAPWNVPGVPAKQADGLVKPRSTSNFIVGVAGDARQWVDQLVRGSSVLNRMRKGESFRQAFDTVMNHQINYDPRSYSRFERTKLKRLFPFYSFISRSIPMVGMELATNPGGRLGQAIRAERFAQGGEDSYVPYDLQDSTAINLGSSPNGDVKYLTNLGLMHEDALTYLMPTQGVRGLLSKVIGSSNPLVKGVIEEATNTSTFFDGPMGGRRLDDLDPAIGRILNNIKRYAHSLGLTGPPDQRPEPFISPLFEAVAANSPASAAMRYARIITEPSERRSVLEKLFNLGTGGRTKIVTAQAMTRELQDRLNQAQIEMGAHPITIATGVQKLAVRMAESGDIEGAQRLVNIQRSIAFLRKKLEEQAEKQSK